MLSTSRNKGLLAGAAGVSLVLALAVSAGAVPGIGDAGPVRAAALTSVEETAPIARQPGDSARAADAPATAGTPSTAPAPPSTAVAKPPTAAAPPTTKAPIRATIPATPTPPPTVAPVTTLPAPIKVARRTPSTAEVQGVITELKRQVGGLLLLVSPTPAQIDQAGDQVCTAFDSGQTVAQVRATGLSMIPPAVTVPPTTADWAVRQAVALYCPGHTSKLA